jgi:hypothetical protein
MSMGHDNGGAGMKRMLATAVLGAALATGAVAGAQEFWETKPYTEWTKEQCAKVLESSPWASHTGARDVQNMAFSKTSTQGQESERRIDYFAQVRSALPVRQAVIRRAMLERKYEKMTAEEKQAFDQSASQYLARQYPDVIVITVEYSSNIEDVDRDLARYWQTVAPATIAAQTYLTVRNGVRIQPVKYDPDPGAGRAFQLVFKRTLENGEPIIGPGDRLLLELPTPTFEAASPTGAAGLADSTRPSAINPNSGPVSRGLKESRAVFEFKGEKMKYKGNLTY